MSVTFEVLVSVEVDAITREQAQEQASKLDASAIVLDSKRLTDATE